MQTKNRYLLNLLVIITDLLIINACYFGVLFLLKQFKTELLYGHHYIFLLVFNLIWIGAAGVWDLYHTSTIYAVEKVYLATIKTSATLVVIFISTLYISAYNNGHKWMLIGILIILLSGCLTFSRFLFTILSARLQLRPRNKLRVSVLGDNSTSVRLAKYFSRHPRVFHYAPISIVNIEPTNMGTDSWYQQMSEGIITASNNNIQEVYLCLPPEKMLHATALMTEAEALYLRLKVVPDMDLDMSLGLDLQLMQQFPVFSLPPKVIVFMKSRAKKRLFDLVFSLLVIILILSWLYPIIALIIKLQSRGPVLFKQQRSGRNNLPFSCYKFRSMRINTESDQRMASRNDERITAIGKLLRRTSLDELPQFFNVFKGEMSVVGPRPHMLSHTSRYQAVIDSFMVRHAIKPGITGLAQVHGFRGQLTDDSQMVDRLDKDLVYIKEWNLLLDVRIIFLTIFLCIKGQKNAF